MDSRAYGALKKPTSLYRLKLGINDYFALAILIVGAGFGLYAVLLTNMF
jgi:energy-coupling factor transporter transmembrane protein EcfT